MKHEPEILKCLNHFVLITQKWELENGKIDSLYLSYKIKIWKHKIVRETYEIYNSDALFQKAKFESPWNVAIPLSLEINRRLKKHVIENIF